ncbi:DUF2058 domain-containing protein [Candidatus Marithrix sp. Canyon 246]|uniref:DUF2058 domain-containing protein n=1 Tax=Candidatus Marithrix sp. Canyon 246 TaxID=1827136 RepID=UPI00084A17B7|nr:DUF2058 domain-containing protein [Candidatus Marithrix sp. Canyon 246]
MAGSLQDQLLSAGMASKKQANKINAQKRQKKRKNHAKEVDEIALSAAKAIENERKKSQELNKQRTEEAEQKAIAAQVIQIIKMNSIDMGTSENALSYNFTDNSKIKTINISKKNQDLISRGRLAIAKIDEDYYLIPAEAAEKIKQRDDESIVLFNENISDQSQDDDDPYADYKVPDDLMW